MGMEKRRGWFGFNEARAGTTIRSGRVKVETAVQGVRAINE